MGMVACAVTADMKDKTLSLGNEAIGKGVADAWVYQAVAAVYIENKDLTKAKEVLAAGKQKFPNESAIYLAELRIAFEEKDTQRATQIINEGKSKFPDKKADFILEEVNIFLTQGDDEKASKALEEAIEAFQNEKEILKVLYFNAGIIYDNLAKKSATTDKNLSKQQIEKAKSYYEKTLEVDPNYVSAYNQLANYHVIVGNDYITEANNLPFEKKKEYDELKAKATGEYKKAAEYLEKGYSIKKDATIKNNLIEIYKKTQEYDKMKALQNEK
jgi:tetratricopeptide (TPR) repeat protein